ncbi:roquin-1, partial [Asbolus verrucosus]
SSTPSWKECSDALEAVRQVVAGLVEFIHQHGSRKLQDTTHSQHAKYKISMCRDLTLRGNCPRGTNCTFAHSNEELEKYRAKNRKTIIRNKEHRIDSPSPTEKVYPQTEDYYSMPNTATVSPIPIPAVVQIQRMSYDVAFNHNFPPNNPYPAPQPMYPQTGAPYPHDVYQTAPPNLVLANNDQFYPQQADFNMGHQSNQEKRPNWDSMIAKNQNVQTKRSSTKSLAELHQRKQEVISQLEKVVGKNAATAISNNATSLARQESQHDLDNPTSPYTFWTGHANSGPTFVRSDSILAADDDYVPYDSPAISKYGPISRMHKDNGQVSSFRDGNLSSPLIRRPLASASPVTSFYYNNNPPFHQGSIPPGHAIVGHPGSGIGSPQLIFHQRMQDPSKELLAESQRVKLQLCNLEKQLNDLKLATQGVTTLSERDRLTQELQLIEQGIQEKQKEACLV